MSEREVKRCQKCREPIVPDGYGDWVHKVVIDGYETGFYMCEGKAGEVATP